MTKPYTVKKSVEIKPIAIRPMTDEERRASLQRAQANHNKDNSNASS